MPNYEPTPRRFSVISVSRSASRRNSIDGPARPNLVQDSTSSTKGPTALVFAEGSNLLRDVAGETDRERGRSRQRAGHIEPKIVWGNDDPVRAPSARRDNSASTRERIAIWEERSRSQSNGRSKSRGRDLRMGSRISMVPEVPELAASFSKFDKEKQESIPDNADTAINEGIFPENREVQASPSPRPHTPIRAGDGLLPTPDATPRQPHVTDIDLKTGLNDHEEIPSLIGAALDKANLPPAPSTPRQSAATLMPPTPKGTPESSRVPKKSEVPEDAIQALESTQDTALVTAYTQIFHPDQTSEDSVLEEEAELRTTLERPIIPTILPTESGVALTKSLEMSQNVQGNQQTRTLKQTDTHDSDPQYHQVWRISSYEPDFPLPPPSSYSIGIDSPAQPRFEGNPLQKLPQSQRATGDAPYRTRVTVNEYPYPANDKNSSTGDWIINIPETYPSAQERTSVAESRSHRRSKPASGSDSRKYTTHPITPKHHEWDAPPVIERAIHAASISMIQTLQVPIKLYDNLHKIYYPPPNRPNIIKAYPIRRRLPARIFFPTQHDLTSPILLPTLFTIHGGTFTLGSPQDDDVWNRTFSDSNSTLVIALNYSKSPWTSFPTPLQDVEAIYHAALNDDSLPIDRMRTAILGFDAGGNLALALSQLPSVKSGIDPHGLHVEYPYFHQQHEQQTRRTRSRCNPPPSAVISVCAILDFTASASEKAKTRPYKNNLKGIRGWGPGLDWVAKVLPSSAWSYIPYGQDVTDPLLSPVYSAREDLPPHVFVVAAELDCLAHESWRAATSWSGGRRAVPSGDEVVGRKEIAVWRGCLDDGRGRDASRFQWMEEFDGTEGKGSTSWLLVPDVVHGFDSAGWRNKYLWGDEEARMDAEMKTVAYQREIGEWLWGIVWR